MNFAYLYFYAISRAKYGVSGIGKGYTLKTYLVPVSIDTAVY